MNNLDIEDRSKIERQIAGALKSAIAAHGPITSYWSGSAAKRVYGLLKQLAKEQRSQNIECWCGQMHNISEPRHHHPRCHLVGDHVGEDCAIADIYGGI